MVPARFQRNTTTFTTWVPPPLSFPTPSTQRRISIDFGSYKWLNARFHELLARWICSQKGKEKRGWTEWSPYKSQLLELWGSSFYTSQAFLFSPKTNGNCLYGAGLFSKHSLR
jgi:hypothetical protein